MKYKLKLFFKRLICKHKYEMIEDTCHMKDGGMSKGADFECSKCGKRTWSDIFARRVNG